MTREQFIQLVNENGGRLNDGGSRGFENPSALSVGLLGNDSVGLHFYSGSKLNQPNSVNGPWLGTQLLNAFAQFGDDVNVSTPRRRRTQTIDREGYAAKVLLNGVTFGLTQENDDRIRSFGVIFANFLNQVFGETANPNESRDRYNEDNSVFVNAYADRRRTTLRGLSREELANRQLNDADNQQEPLDDEMEQDMPTANPITESRNLIYFGAPGTGKSHKLKKDVEEKFPDRYERVTFYPTYSYAQFVGCYKPVMKPKIDGSSGEEIAYEFVPGPFLRILVKALKYPDNDYCLVIEEINRANAAAVFSDVFQLLDRDDSGASEYDVTMSEDVKKFFRMNGIEADRLRIPSNMYIWATMNSADQGVFPMDTAFKRRWEFKYIGIDEGQDDCAEWQIEGRDYRWNEVRTIINGLLSQHGVNEDKLMGAHFVKVTGDNVSATAFESKVLMYLWEDAARMCRRAMFGNILTYSQLVEQWRENGIKVFENDNTLAKLPTELHNLFDSMVNSQGSQGAPGTGQAENNDATANVG